VIFWEGLVLIMAFFNRDIGELQYKKVVVESGSRRYVEIQLLFFINFIDLADCLRDFHFVLLGSSQKRTELK